MAECVAAKMRNLFVQTAALREIGGNRMQAGLPFERGDMATGAMREKACGTAQARADIEHPACGPESELFGRAANGIDAVTMAPIQGEQLLGSDRIHGADTKSSQIFVDSI